MRLPWKTAIIAAILTLALVWALAMEADAQSKPQTPVETVARQIRAKHGGTMECHNRASTCFVVSRDTIFTVFIRDGQVRIWARAK